MKVRSELRVSYFWETRRRGCTIRKLFFHSLRKLLIEISVPNRPDGVSRQQQGTTAACSAVQESVFFLAVCNCRGLELIRRTRERSL